MSEPKSRITDEYIIEVMQKQYDHAIKERHQNFGDLTFVLDRNNVLEICQFLKNHPQLSFNLLMDLSCVDYLGRESSPRFEVVYHLYSLQNRNRVRLKVMIEEMDPYIPSMTSVWTSANWYEREVWDMFGITFEGHPNLKRILMYEEFEGHPLRKDYPYNRRHPLIGPKN